MSENNKEELIEKKRVICLLSDSFPPAIDGVSNTVKNYAEVISASCGDAVVLTPEWPGSDDEGRAYPVLRYPSIDTRKMIGYVTGLPITAKVLAKLKEHPVDVLHVHCPTVSLVLAREIREIVDAPIVFTYHTKYDMEIRRGLKVKALQEGAIRAMIENISACDEVWVVSEGAGENLRSLGYKGEYRVMNNGVDIPRGRVSEELICETTAAYDLPEGVPVFLFVGRMLWYKGQRLILEALEGLHSQGVDFRMVFIGNGGDLEAMRTLSEELGISDKVIFTGAIRNRDAIRAWYCRADAFLFPSTFDTNGLVVREAAACGLASVLVKGSCAAEGVTDGVNGFLISETASSLAIKLYELCKEPESMKRVGICAEEELYISWDEAVHTAFDRYEEVIKKYNAGEYDKKRNFTSEGLKVVGGVINRKTELLKGIAELQERMESFAEALMDSM